MKRKTLEVLFLEELADMYDCEIRLTRALPKMARTATHMELRDAFQRHLDETDNHVIRLKRVFQSFEKDVRGRKCEAIVGLIKEADEIVADNKGCPTINAALICAAQKVEHYEIASYGCLAEWADQLGNDEAVDLLQQTLDEEKAADKTLTALARLRCNESAQDGASEEEDAPQMGRGRAIRPARNRARA
jgi:ferritin-like metal-binding protein YciE